MLDNTLRFVVPALAGLARLVPITSLVAEQTSLIALRNAAQRGRLRAQRGDDGQWRSTKTWVEECLLSRHHRTAS